MQNPVRRLVLILIVGVLGSLIPAQGLQADDASKAAVIEEMFVLTKVDALMQQVMAQIKMTQQAQLEKMELPAEAQANASDIHAKVMALVSDRLKWEKLKPLYVKLYADTFSEEELRATVAFYRSPAGKAMMEKMPAMMGASMKLVQDQVGDLTPEVKRIVEAQAEKQSENREKKASQPKDL